MKPITFFSFFLVFFAQAQNYNFVMMNETYNDLQNATSINNAEVWDDPEYPLQMPFSFDVNGMTFNGLVVNDSYVLFNNDNSDIAQIVSPMGIDLLDRGYYTNTSNSPISSRVDGNAGERILKIEFKNCGSFSDDSLMMFLNFQIWLYETSNVIEFRFGSSSIPSPQVFYDGESGGLLAITPYDSLNEELLEGGISLSGSASNPTLVNQIVPINGTPPANTVYRFSPQNLSNINFDSRQYTFYPNPSFDFLNFDSLILPSKFSIFNLTGQMLMEGTVSQSQINIGALEIGTYFIRINDSDPQKFIKK